MSLRSFINLGWQLLKEGLDDERIKEVQTWLDTPPETPEQVAERERRARARENKAAVSGLSDAFKLATG
jgi:hypothetical protein